MRPTPRRSTALRAAPRSSISPPEVLHAPDCDPTDRLPNAAGSLRGWVYQVCPEAAGLDTESKEVKALLVRVNVLTVPLGRCEQSAPSDSRPCTQRPAASFSCAARWSPRGASLVGVSPSRLRRVGAMGEAGTRRRMGGIALMTCLLFACAPPTTTEPEASGDPGDETPETVAVPDVVGLSEEVATEVLEREGFDVAVREAEQDGEPGHVVSQNPDPDTEHGEGSAVIVDLVPPPRETPIPTPAREETDDSPEDAASDATADEPAQPRGQVYLERREGDGQGFAVQRNCSVYRQHLMNNSDTEIVAVTMPWFEATIRDGYGPDADVRTVAHSPETIEVSIPPHTTQRVTWRPCVDESGVPEGYDLGFAVPGSFSWRWATGHERSACHHLGC